MSSLALSVLLSLVSAVAYAAAAIVQEHVAADASGRPYALLRNAGWWISVGLNGAGGLLHVVALAYGPLSLVQPLGALTIVFALPMAAVFVRRRAASTAWRGAVMATAGLAGLLALTGPADSRAPGGAGRLVLAAAAFAAIAAVFLAAQRARRPVVRGVVLAGGAGVAFGVASVFTKIATEDLTELPGGTVTGLLPGLMVIAGLASAGLLLSQASYRGAGLAAPLATVTVVNPVVAATVGVTLFGERFRYGATGTALAVACAAVAAAGLVRLTTEQPHVPAAGGTSDPSGDRGLPGLPGSPGLPRLSDRHAAFSDRDAARPEVGERVDVGAVPRPRAHLEVEMRSRAVAGGP
ncbi:DMT family transporter [Streptomyces sp. NPDC059909]|uniref:DMT family transporter n=1 Tax=Streptomyces sp. NPDC059909 TaxID=3346998 RepID=UPI003650E09B